MKEYERLAEQFKVLGHPDRIKIILNLEVDGCNVGKIQKGMNLAQATVSQHMSLLKRVGIVSSNRNGNEVCYKVCDETIKMIMKNININ